MAKISTLPRAAETVAAADVPVGGAAKRALDIVIAASALIVLSPLMLMIMLVMKLTDPGPIVFGHKRVGFEGKHFHCYKFRSMATNSAELLQRLLQSDPVARAEWETSQKLRNDPRVTKLGRILRETSLDELPQLVNVLKGDMSLVGPRPIVDEEIYRYSHRFEAYKRVRPGVTGMWQVNGRSDTTYASRVKFDTFYVRNWSVPLDIGILFKTVAVVLKREGSR